MHANRPLFVVGCSRSGTTLVQSLLATSDRLLALPETNRLYAVADDLDRRRFGHVGGVRRVLRDRLRGLYNRAGLTRKFDWSKNVDKLPQALGDEVRRRALGRERSIARIYTQFGEMLDAVAGDRRWVEKSPQNIFVLDLIERHFAQPQFVHIVRSPLDNIASLVDAARKYSTFGERFGGANGLVKAVRYYNRALSCSVARRGADGHLILRYEALAADVDRHLRRLEAFLGLPADSLHPVYDTTDIVKDHEVWKRNSRAIRPASSKAHEVFTAEQIAYVERHALDPDRWFPA